MRVNFEKLPILYSFRRCPYAMRARMALIHSKITIELREVILRDKPDEMIMVSPKATVPVLILPDGSVIDESIDIVYWALQQNDPQNWMEYDAQADKLIKQADGPFKTALDRYKYHNRYADAHPETERNKALIVLHQWNEIIGEKGYFFGNYSGLADITIFPFVRQFANHDRAWFDALNIPYLQSWLIAHIHSNLFDIIMKKYPQWQKDDKPQLLQ